ncbi:MAG: cation transporter [Clostridia bacterium]|nr:cation transporter [Clostridia bacterium]
MVRFRAVRRVLLHVLILNLLVAGAKLVLGWWSGTASLVADGFHSLMDSSSNVIGLLGIRLASRPADEDHPYGHQKFETFASLGIAGLLVITAVEVFLMIFQRLRTGAVPTVTSLHFVVILGTMVVNAAVTAYERRAGARLGSTLLTADARHTWSDILVSSGVLAGLVAVRAGYPVADALVAGAIGLVIVWAAVQVVRESSSVLLDRVALDPAAIRRVVENVEGVQNCHAIRSRSSGPRLHIDLHIQVDPSLPVAEGHAIAHRVKAALADAFDAEDVVIHVEPDADAARAPRGAPPARR